MRIYGAAGWLAAPFLRRMLKRRVGMGKEISERLGERYGVAGLARPVGRLVWIHAASVGETMSVLSVIEALGGETEVLLTTGTVTSARLAAGRLPGHARHQFVPLDVAAWVGRFLDYWRPDVAVFVESEIWPGLVRGVDARGIPRMLVNASLSERSVKRWRVVTRFWNILIFGFRWVHVQSGRDALRFGALGAAGILAWGNLKYAAPVLPVDEGALLEMRGALGGGPVWVAASTHEGEEAMVLAAHEVLVREFPGLVTVVAPRHVERGGVLAGPRRSLGMLPVGGQVYVADTMGELGLFYRLCGVAFVGGSLVPVGGHNLAEAARLGVAVICGPYTGEIVEQVEALKGCGGMVEVCDAVGLAAAVGGWLRDPGAAAAAGVAARGAFAGLDGLPGRIAGLILETAL